MASKWRAISAEEAKAHPLYGVGGWLLLLVAGMMVLGPLLGVGRIGSELMDAERQYPALSSLDEWHTFKTVTWWTFAAIAALSFYGGWGLARGNDWSVVRRAKAILWISGPVGSLVMGVLVPLATFGKSNVGDAQFVGGLLAAVLTATVWTAYLSKSKRVRVTFAHCVLAKPSNPDDKSQVQEKEFKTRQHSVPVTNAAPISAQQDTTMSANLEEEFWAKALAEYESSVRRPGLWARVFSQAQGNEAVAKASYLKHRAEELSLEHQQRVRAQEQAEQEAIKTARLARLTEEQRAYELLPKGHCPSCKSVIPISVQECPICHALFGPESAWKILPIKDV